MKIDHNDCAILERTADGISVGRCWYYLKDDMCPRHGNVKAVQDHYRLTGELTDERDFVRADLPLPLPTVTVMDHPVSFWSRFKKWW